jgi:shikimate kinase
MELKGKHIVLVGLMGAGKTSVGRQLASQMNLTFVDTDLEVEYAAGLRISDIFEIYGEDAFRELEEKVIARVLKEPGPTVIATGGGAYMSKISQQNIKAYGVSIWLKASLDILMERIVTTVHRPILQTGNRREVLAELIDKRYPIYGQADIMLEVDKTSAGNMAHKLRRVLKRYLKENP